MTTIVSKALSSTGALFAFAVATLPTSAFAGEVHKRVNDQQARIDQGVASGQLTRREYDRDESRLDHIDAQRDRDLARNDGRLTAGEHARLNRELNGSSRNIYYTKHDLARQPGAPRI